MQSFVIILALCWPPSPAPSKPIIAPIPDEPITALDGDQAASTGAGTAQATPSRARIVIGYRKVCVNGVCRQVPVYAEPAPILDPPKIGPAPPLTDAEIAEWKETGKVPAKPPPHTHPDETGEDICPWCPDTCAMVRISKALAAKKGTTAKEEFNARYRSSTRQTQPTYRYRSRGVFRGRGLFRGGAGLSGGIVPGRI